MLHIETEVEVATSPNRVWHALVDFPRYPEWNPYIAVRGTSGAGLDIEWSFGVYGGKRMWTPVVVTAHQEPRRLAWGFGLGRLFSFEEAFSLTDAQGRTLLRHSFKCAGLIARLAKPLLKRRLQKVLSAADSGLQRYLSASATPAGVSKPLARRSSIGPSKRRRRRGRRG